MKSQAFYYFSEVFHVFLGQRLSDYDSQTWTPMENIVVLH